VPDAGIRAEVYAERKQQMVVDLIEAGEFSAFPDALRFVRALSDRGLRLAAASSSVDISGRDLARGKPDPEIFLTAASELGIPAGECFVVEDAVVGIEAARAAGMAALGVARADDAERLAVAEADLVVTTLDDVALDRLAEGGLSSRAA
jgi:beta-phosphoglucomutase